MNIRNRTNATRRAALLSGMALLISVLGATTQSMPAAHAGPPAPSCASIPCPKPQNVEIQANVNSDWSLGIDGSGFTPQTWLEVDMFDAETGNQLGLAGGWASSSGTVSVSIHPWDCGSYVRVVALDWTTWRWSNTVTLTYCPS